MVRPGTPPPKSKKELKPGEIAVLRLPLTFSETPAAVGTGPVHPDHHTREILAELGYSEADMATLKEAGAI